MMKNLAGGTERTMFRCRYCRCCYCCCCHDNNSTDSSCTQIGAASFKRRHHSRAGPQTGREPRNKINTNKIESHDCQPTVCGRKMLAPWPSFTSSMSSCPERRRRRIARGGPFWSVVISSSNSSGDRSWRRASLLMDALILVVVMLGCLAPRTMGLVIDGPFHESFSHV